jgi:hypothetical protein
VIGDEDGFDSIWMPRIHAAGGDVDLVRTLDDGERRGAFEPAARQRPRRLHAAGARARKGNHSAAPRSFEFRLAVATFGLAGHMFEMPVVEDVAEGDRTIHDLLVGPEQPKRGPQQVYRQQIDNAKRRRARMDLMAAEFGSILAADEATEPAHGATD